MQLHLLQGNRGIGFFSLVGGSVLGRHFLADGFFLPSGLRGSANVRLIVALTIVAVCNGIEARALSACGKPLGAGALLKGVATRVLHRALRIAFGTMPSHPPT